MHKTWGSVAVTRADREAALDLWAAGQTAPKITLALRRPMRRYTVDKIERAIIEARQVGDPRATYHRGPRRMACL